MAAFKPGDTVRIKGDGGEVMTVEKIEKLHHLEFAHCRWFDTKTNSQWVAGFPLSSLELVHEAKDVSADGRDCHGPTSRKFSMAK